MQQQVIDNLINPKNSEILLGLERITQVLAHMGNPQERYKVIHITGTNGKGSVAAFLECGLHHAGYKVGKFTSPHINSINETIRYNLENISDAELERWYFIVANILTQQQLKLSQFELLTVIMFAYFASIGIDYLVLEVGMGGRQDATNVITKPECVVITNISLEHTQWLGNTLADIAYEKSGLIKHNCPVIIADNGAELINAVTSLSTQVINVLNQYNYQVKLNFNNFTTDLLLEHASQEEYILSLFGEFQAQNFLCAHAVFKLLQINKISIDYAASHTKHNGRLERICASPLIVADATHNPGGAKVLQQTLSRHYVPDDVVIITSILRDKDIPSMLSYFCQIASTIIFTSLDSTTPRGLAADELLHIAITKLPNVTRHTTQFIAQSHVKSAITHAKTLNKKLILISGSLYLLCHIDLR